MALRRCSSKKRQAGEASRWMLRAMRAVLVTSARRGEGLGAPKRPRHFGSRGLVRCERTTEGANSRNELQESLPREVPAQRTPAFG